MNFMKKFCLVSLAVVGLGVGACTDVDPFFANDLIPPSQQMNTRIDTVMPLTTYQITFDSISGRIVGSASVYPIEPLGYVGSVIDPFVGRTTTGIIGNFVPDAYTKNDTWQEKLFGTDPTVDSMTLSVSWNAALTVGDTTQKFKVKVYPINKRLRSWENYYTCFDPAAIYDPAAPLTEFTTNGVDFVTVKLPMWYAQQFITPEYNQKGVNKPYSSDSVFLDTFKGLYFKAEPVAPGTRGVIGAMNMSDTELFLHYHNKNEKADTTSLGYFFYYVNEDNSALYYTPYNTTFVVATHDYQLATSPHRVDPKVINQANIPCATLFVQGLGGLAVRAKLDTERIKQIQTSAQAKGYRHVAIHRAELRWKVPEKTLSYYDDSFASLVMGNWRDSRRSMLPLPDYDPWNTNNSTNAMGGELIRSLGYYSQNITSYIQRVLNGTTTYDQLLLIPDFGTLRDNLDPLRSVLVGSEGPTSLRPELIVTYTLIR